MGEPNATVTHQIARATVAFVCQRTGHAPGSVDVALRDDAWVISLQHLGPATERSPEMNPEETGKHHERYRDVFAESSDWLRREIHGITGVPTAAVTAAIDAGTGAVVVLITRLGPHALDSRADSSVRPGHVSTSNASPGVALSSGERPAQKPNQVEDALPKSTDGPFARACGSIRRFLATPAPAARACYQLASRGIASAGAARGGQV